MNIFRKTVKTTKFECRSTGWCVIFPKYFDSSQSLRQKSKQIYLFSVFLVVFKVKYLILSYKVATMSLTESCIKTLGDKQYEKRKIAALEIEKWW